MPHAAVKILLAVFQLPMCNGQRMSAAAAKKESSEDVLPGICRRASVTAANLLNSLKQSFFNDRRMRVFDDDLLLLWNLPDLLCLVVDDLSSVRAELAQIDTIAKH